MPETGARKWIITFTVILSSVIELIDTSIVNVALPQMMGNLGATLDEAAWVVTSYVVGNVIVVPMAGWLSSYFGRRNYFAFSILLFTAASVMCGRATSIWELVAFRFIQGLGGGALLTTSQTILVETFPREQLGFASALFGLGVVAGPTIGPTLGGWITDNFNWPWIFYINVPIGLLAAFLTLTFIQDHEHGKPEGSIDWWGMALLVIAVGSLQVVLERGERLDWFAARSIVVLAILAGLGLIAFIWRELAAKDPVVNLRVLRDRSLAAGMVLTFILGFGLYASVFIFPVFAQQLLGFTPTQTGLILMPGGLATALMMPFVGRMLQKGFPPQLMVAMGFSIFFIFCEVLSRSTLSAEQHDFFWPLVLRGVGLSFLFVPITTLALGGLHGRDIAQGSGLTNMTRQLGGSFGVALVATFVQQRAWVHRTALLSHLSLFDTPLQERLNLMVQGFLARGSTLAEAQQRAYAALEGTVLRQTYLLTYMDAFRFVGAFFLLCLPLLLLFRRRRKTAGAPAPMH